MSSSLAWKVLVFKDGAQYGSMGPYLGRSAEKDARADAKAILADSAPGVTAQVVKTRWNPSRVIHYEQNLNPRRKRPTAHHAPEPTGPRIGYPYYEAHVFHEDDPSGQSKLLPGDNNRFQFASFEGAKAAIEDWIEHQEPYKGKGKVTLRTQGNPIGETVYWFGAPHQMDHQGSLFTRRRNPHLVPGEQATFSNQYLQWLERHGSKHYSPRELETLKLSSPGHIVTVLEQIPGGYKVFDEQPLAGHPHEQNYSDESLVSAQSGTDQWPGTNYDGVEPSYQDMRAAGWFFGVHQPSGFVAPRDNPDTFDAVMETGLGGAHITAYDSWIAYAYFFDRVKDAGFSQADAKEAAVYISDRVPLHLSRGVMQAFEMAFGMAPDQRHPSQRSLDPAITKSQGPEYPEYKFYVVHKPSKTVVSGWDYREDAQDSLDEFLDMGGIPKSHLSVMTARGVKGRFGGIHWLEGPLTNPDWKAMLEKAKGLAESAASAGRAGATRIKEEAELVAAKARIAKIESEIKELQKCAKALGNVHRPKLPDRYEIEAGRLLPGITEYNLTGGLKPEDKEGYEGLFEKREQLVDAKTALAELQRDVEAARKERG